MRVRALLLVFGLLMSACGDDSSDAPVAVEPVPGGTYSGPLTAQANLSGRVTIEVSDTGSEIVGLLLYYDMTDYDCGGGIVINGPGAAVPMGISVPITESSFSYPTSMGIAWAGTVTSPERVTGTLEGDLVSPPCSIGPLEWSADLQDPEPSDGDAATTTQPEATTTTGTWTVPAEYAELCEISKRIMDRVATAPASSESQPDFWRAQRDDNEAMADLVPAELRADMETRAQAWRDFVDLLERYDFVFDAMVADIGVEAVNEVFLDQDVIDAGGRIDGFLSEVCLGE